MTEFADTDRFDVETIAAARQGSGNDRLKGNEIAPATA